MRTRRVAAGALVSAIALAAASPAAASPGITREHIQLLPRLAGVRIEFGSATYVSDERGRVFAPIGSTEVAQRAVRVPEQVISEGVRVRQGRWYPGLQLALDVDRLVRFSFTDRAGAPLEPDGLTSMLIKSTTGGLYRYDAAGLDQAHWLHAQRVVPVQGRLRVAPIEYSIEQVVVRGSNVVNESQQRFDPGRVQDVRVWLLFFPAEFTVKDAVFGFPIGSSLTLRFPDGRTMTLPLEDGRASVSALPRGEYEVSVDGLGVTLSVPVALSRPQEADVMFLSYLDIAVAVAFMAGFLVGLPLLGRALRRRRLVVVPVPGGPSTGGGWDSA